MSHRGDEDLFLESLFPDNIDGLRVVDAGTGYCKTAWWIRTVLGMRRGWCKLYGLEIFPPYYSLALRLKIHDEVRLHDVLTPWPYPEGYFDISIGQQIIEHLTKEEGLVFLKNMEKYTKDRVIIATPHGYTDSTPLDGNDRNNHRSGWLPEDFEALGYNTKVIVHRSKSRVVSTFDKCWYTLRGKTQGHVVAWKDISIYK